MERCHTLIVVVFIKTRRIYIPNQANYLRTCYKTEDKQDARVIKPIFSTIMGLQA